MAENVRVEIENNKFESGLKKFKRAVNKAEISDNVKKRAHHVKKSEQKQINKKEARRRQRQQTKSNQLPEKLY